MMNITFTGSATLQAGDDLPLSATRDITIDAGMTATIDTNSYTVTIPGDINPLGGTGALNVIDSSTLGGGTVILSGSNNDYDGWTNIEPGGTLQLADYASPGAATGILYLGGKLNLNGQSITVGSLQDEPSGTPGTGTVTTASTEPASLTVAPNDPQHPLDTFSGDINGPILLKKAGSQTLALAGTDTYTVGTAIIAGTLQLDSDAALPVETDLSMGYSPSSPATLDLNGYSASVTAINAPSNASNSVVTNGGASSSTISIGNQYNVPTSPMDSTFPGKIADGTGHVEVDIYNTTVTLTGTENYSGGTYLYFSTTFMVTATLLLGNGTNNTMVTGEISVNDEGWITFYAGLGIPETFTGYIEASPNPYPNPGNSNCLVTKAGPGTLTMAPSQASNYQSLTLTGGTLALANSLALPAGVNIEIDGGATLNLGGLSDLPAVNDVTMNNGIITDGTLALVANAWIQVGYGEIDANLSGDVELDKIWGTGSIAGVPDDTVVLTTLSDSGSFTGTTDVEEGTLIVNGTLGGQVIVGSSTSGSAVATLGGTGTLSGLVSIQLTGVLSLGSTTGDGAITMGQLKLESGSLVDDEIGSADTCLAQVTGALTIQSGVTLSVTEDTVYVPYQVLFHYGSLVGSLANLSCSLPPNASLFNDATSIYLTLKPMLYWTAAGNTTLGGSGPWDASHYYWWDPTTLSAVQWQSGDIAVFEETGTGAPKRSRSPRPSWPTPPRCSSWAVIIRSLAAARSPCRQSPRSPSRPGSPRRSAPRWTVASFWRVFPAGSSCSLEPITTRAWSSTAARCRSAPTGPWELGPGHQLPTSRSPATALCSGPEPLIYTRPARSRSTRASLPRSIRSRSATPFRSKSAAVAA